MKLAQRTGGSYWLYSGDEQFPSIDAYFEPHRNIYRLGYDSELKTSGNHTLTARINSQLGQFTSQSQSFELDIQPPLPVFVMPPIQILRNLSESGKNLSGGEDVPERFLPNGQNFSVIFDFLDRHPRQIVRSSLYVDGFLTEESTMPPFNEFHWNIGNYIENGSHRIQIEAQDILGLVGRSIELPVEIKIVRPQRESRISVYKDFALESLSVFIPAGFRRSPRLPWIP